MVLSSWKYSICQITFTNVPVSLQMITAIIIIIIINIRSDHRRIQYVAFSSAFYSMSTHPNAKVTAESCHAIGASVWFNQHRYGGALVACTMRQAAIRNHATSAVCYVFG